MVLPARQRMPRRVPSASANWRKEVRRLVRDLLRPRITPQERIGFRFALRIARERVRICEGLERCLRQARAGSRERNTAHSELLEGRLELTICEAVRERRWQRRAARRP